MISCSDLRHVRDGRRITVAGLILVRQKPGSAKGVTFMTVEDETDVANIVIWSTLFEKQRRLILSSGLIGCRGRLQREGEVVHLIAEHFIDLSDLLRSVGERDQPLRMRHGRGDEAKAGTREMLRRGVEESAHSPPACTPEHDNACVLRIAARNFR